SNNLLCDNQSGFRPKHSCFTSLTKLTEDWQNSINNKEIVEAVLIDFRKAFDLIDHQLLLRKLQIYGIYGKELD
ncbi:reverse transcriptase domain-containing protein, partial [Klebsiella pneumoniae]|nr:reverse transcriptase domain-containing protein [Klebsiella pneumoniae]